MPHLACYLLLSKRCSSPRHSTISHYATMLPPQACSSTTRPKRQLAPHLNLATLRRVDLFATCLDGLVGYRSEAFRPQCMLHGSDAGDDSCSSGGNCSSGSSSRAELMTAGEQLLIWQK